MLWIPKNIKTSSTVKYSLVLDYYYTLLLFVPLWNMYVVLVYKSFHMHSNLTVVCFPIMISPSTAVEGGHTFSAMCKLFEMFASIPCPLPLPMPFSPFFPCLLSYFRIDLLWYLFNVVLQTNLVVPPCEGLPLPPPPTT